jgi:hypothetical protein
LQTFDSKFRYLVGTCERGFGGLSGEELTVQLAALRSQFQRPFEEEDDDNDNIDSDNDNTNINVNA